MSSPLGSRRGTACVQPPFIPALPRLDSIVRAYIARCRSHSDEELGSFSVEPTVASAIERAGRAETSEGKRYHHQRRLPKALLRFSAKQLMRAHLERAKSFDDLHRRVDLTVGSLHGIGELTVYDSALRIGAKLGLLPRRVYLHRGTRVGARALGLDWRARTLEVGDLPRVLRALRPHEIEDCLCIFKRQLARIGQQRVQRGIRRRDRK